MVRELNSSHGYAVFRKQCLHFFHCHICRTLKFQVRLQQEKKKELGVFYRCALNYFEPSAFPLFLVFYCALRGSLCSLGLAAAVHPGDNSDSEEFCDDCGHSLGGIRCCISGLLTGSGIAVK